MSDQGYSTQKQWSEASGNRVASRAVPIGPVLLTGAPQAVAVAPAQQIMRVEHLAVCNPSAASVELSVIANVGGFDFAQIAEMPIPAKTSTDLTDLIGQLYASGTVLSAVGDGLVLSGRYGAVL